MLLIWPNDFDTLGEWLEVVHAQYRGMVYDAGLVILGKPLVRSGPVCADGRDATFWHLVTDSGFKDGVRRLSLGRAAYLGRVWQTLERLAAGDESVVWWRTRRFEGVRVHVAPLDFGLHVVLHEARGAFLLKTAYPLTREGQREEYLSRAVCAWASGDCSPARAVHQRSPQPSKEWPAWERARRWMG